MVAYGGAVMEPACAFEFRSCCSILLTSRNLMERILTAIELCPFLKQAAGVACLIAGAVRHRPCCAVLIKGAGPSGSIVPALRAAQRDLGDRNE
jgi:hypothetical protein